MAGYSQDGRYSQEFYLHSPGDALSIPETLTIPVRWDAELGRHIILLSDVQLVFKDARRFLDNGEIVPFIKDHASQELTPLRIEYRHGVVLEALEADGEGDSGTNTNPTTMSSVSDVTSHIVETSQEGPYSHYNNGTESLPTLQHLVEELTITDGAARSHVHDTASGCYTDLPLLAHINHYGSYINDMMSSQETRMSRAQSSMKHLVESMNREISENRNQMRQMSELIDDLTTSKQEDEQIQSNKQENEQHMLGKQQQILQAQRRGINRLVAIQECVQDAADMVFTALEHPLHHLFVVFPFGYESGSHNFRLFFLCEHDQPSKTENRAPLSNIHLARHEGYELQDADEFFQDYAPYLMSIFHILKNGTTSPGFDIPRLSYMMLAKGVDEVQDILKLSDNTILSLMNETTSYMINKGYCNSMNRMNSRVALDAVKSADLCSVIKHLKGYKRNGHTLGNLLQIVTSEGDIKWVCDDRYHERYHGIEEEHQDEEDTAEADEDNIDEDVQLHDIQSQDEVANTTLLDGLNGVKWTEREIAITSARGRVEQDESVLQGLIGAVADPDKNVREAAVRVLRDPSKVSYSARDAVISAVDDTQWNVQEAALQALGDLPQLSQVALYWVDVLISAARSSHMSVQGAAIDALIKHASSESVLQYLVEIIRVGLYVDKAVATEVLATQNKLPEAVVEELITMLEDDSQEVRSSAAFVLQVQNRLPGLAITALLEMVRDKVSCIREVSIRVLANQIAVSESVIPALIAGLEDESSDVQAAAAEALGEKSDLPRKTIQVLTNFLFDRRANVREASAKVLGRQGTLSETTIQALTATLKDEALGVREAVARALGGKFHLPQSTVDTLIGMLDDDDPRVRGAAVYSLGCRTELPDSTVQALVGMLADRDIDVQETAIQALGGKAASSSEVIEDLLRFLESKNPAIRNTAIIALSSDVQLSDATIHKIAINLQDERHYVRVATVQVLSNHVKWSESASEALANGVLGEDMVIRRWAVSALRNRIKLPEAAILTLTGAIKGNNQSVKLDVIRVLGEQVNSSEAAVEALICSLCDLHIHVRRRATEALTNLIQLSESALLSLELVLVLHDEIADIRVAVLNVLSDYVQSSEAVALIILHTLRDTDQYVKDTALQALRKNGLLESTVLLLTERLRSNDKTTKDEAVLVLSGLPNMSGTAVQRLIEYLTDEDKEIRRDAVRLLAGQVKWSEAAAKTFIDALKEDDIVVRMEAWNMLQEMAEFTDAMIQHLLDTLQDDNIMGYRALGMLGLQTSLPGFAIMTLVGALKSQRDHVRTGAHAILLRQKMLSESAAHALAEYTTTSTSTSKTLLKPSPFLLSTLPLPKSSHSIEHLTSADRAAQLSITNPTPSPAALETASKSRTAQFTRSLSPSLSSLTNALLNETTPSGPTSQHKLARSVAKRVYKCEMCSKEFSRLSYLNGHYKTHGITMGGKYFN
ncbi:hypothetical protein BGX34_001569, partial [Mortierella sp. NVP85]